MVMAVASLRKRQGPVAAQKIAEFVARARKIHGRKYDYSRVRYVNVDTPVEVICRKHGSFFPAPWTHVRQKLPTGCKLCSSARAGALRRQAHKKSFIAKARRMHGRKYDYSETEYTHARAKLKIVCREHGAFTQMADAHLRGSGCAQCGFKKRGDDQSAEAARQFVANARNVHGRRYDYRKAIYRKATEKVCIVCTKHGEWWQVPSSHLSGRGCPDCAKGSLATRLTHSRETFIEAARKAHGRKYSYGKQYVNKRTEVSITCKVHGRFSQTPINHTRGAGCPKCARINMAQSQSHSHSDFIALVKKVHGRKFQYPERYVRSDKKIKIVCRRHGPFEQTPYTHLVSKIACPRCEGEASAKRRRLTHDAFTRKAVAIHGRKFTYPDRYRATDQPLRIVCPQHGEFHQTPNSHLCGAGCPTCVESTGERMVSRILEKRKLAFKRQHKFPDCIAERPLRFDFWLPRMSALIEFDGPQHFEARDYFGGKGAFDATKRRDRIKTAYARKKQIRLIRVKYSIKDVEAFLVRRLGLLPV